MRDKQSYTVRPRGILARAADGRLKPTGDEGGPSSRPKADIRPEGKPQTNQPKEIALTINFPSLLRLPKFPKLSSPSAVYARFSKISKRPLLIGATAVIVVVGFGVYRLVTNKQSSGRTSDTNSPAGVLSASNQAAQSPDYSTILPKGKSIDELGGWGRVSPPDRDPVFAFADAIGEVRIIVSEQPLPDSFKSNIADEVTKVARQFSANEKLATGDVPAYVGVATKGQQSVVLARDDLLILIKSDSKITSQQWVAYISSLR